MNDQSAKDAIFASLKNGKPQEVPLPDVPEYEWAGDPLENFIAKLIGFDGKAVKFQKREEAIAWLQKLPEADTGKVKIYSSAQGIEGNISDKDLSELRNAHLIQTCITEGIMGVGETGSIWVTNESLKHAACALLSKQLFILLDKNRIVSGLHEAYAKIKLNDQQYGSFFSGPSATADIEAVHITGAQGPLSLTAVIYNSEDAPVPPELIISPNADSSTWLTEEEKPD